MRRAHLRLAPDQGADVPTLRRMGAAAHQRAVSDDTRTLVALFRSALADVPGNTEAYGAAAILTDLAHLLRDTGPAGGYVQQVVADHGPAAVLRALAEAYDHPAHELGDLEGD